MKFELKGEKIVEGIAKFIYEMMTKLVLFTLPLLTLLFDEMIIQITIIISWWLILNHHEKNIISQNKKKEEGK